MRKIIIPVLLCLAAGSCALSLYVQSRLNKIVVIDVIEVFNEFQMKKDLEKRVEAPLAKIAGQVDSMKALVQQAERSGDETTYNKYMQSLFQMQQEAQSAYELSDKNINEQVWKRLNPLIDEFGKKNNYKVIIGANGMGTVLYNEEQVDRTKELIRFINNAYEKGN